MKYLILSALQDSPMLIQFQFRTAYIKRAVAGSPDIAKISSRLKEKLGEIADTGIFPPVVTVKYLQINLSSICSGLNRGKNLKLYTFLITKGIQYVFQPNRAAEWDVHSVKRQSIGFRGNLTAGEIVNQIISIPEARKITHVVFMGMGEPMDNLENVLKACTIITAEWGLSISPQECNCFNSWYYSGSGTVSQNI